MFDDFDTGELEEDLDLENSETGEEDDAPFTPEDDEFSIPKLDGESEELKRMNMRIEEEEEEPEL